jgi:glycerol-1-phosphate dehydrogenase [NAD(P)+]
MSVQKNFLMNFINQNEKKTFKKIEIEKCKKQTFYHSKNLTNKKELKFFLSKYKKKYQLISDNLIIVEKIDNYIDSLHESFFLTDKNSLNFFKKIYKKQILQNVYFVEKINNGNKLKKFIKNLNLRKKIKDFKLVCIGGGKVFDLGKFVTLKNNIPIISIPTSLTTHVYCSPKIHVMKQIAELGYKKTIDGRPSNLSVIDLNIMKKLELTNSRLLYSGFGDLLALINAKDDWLDYVNQEKNRFKIYCVEVIIKILNTININKNLNTWISEYVFAQCLLCNITDWAGSAPASGSEHFFANLHEKKFKSKALHGELVALGTLIFQKLRNKKIDNLINFLKKFNISRSIGNFCLTKKSIFLTLVHCKQEGKRKKRKSILDNNKFSKIEWQIFVHSLFKDNVLLK